MEIEKLLKELEKTLKEFYKDEDIKINIRITDLEIHSCLNEKEKCTIEIDFSIYD